MTITEDAYRMIRRWEGFEAKWYADAIGVETIGYGTTRRLLQTLRVPPIDPPITKETGHMLLESALTQRFLPRLEDLLDVSLPQPDIDALTSFAYNVGTGAFADSTMRALYNDERFEAARDEYTEWVYAGGQKLDGLVARRKDEQALARTGALPDCTRIDAVEPAPIASLEGGPSLSDLSLQVDPPRHA